MLGQLHFKNPVTHVADGNSSCSHFSLTQNQSHLEENATKKVKIFVIKTDFQLSSTSDLLILH